MGEMDWTFTPNPPPPSPGVAKKKAGSSATAARPGSKSGKIKTSSPAQRAALLAELQKLKTKYTKRAKKKATKK